MLRILFLLAAMLAAMLAKPAFAAPQHTLPVHALPQGSLGLHAQVLEESGPPWTLAEAQAQWQRGAFTQGTSAVFNTGIGAQPLWVRLALRNPGTAAVPLRLAAGATWLDRLDIYLVQDGNTVAAWRAGDERSGAQPPVPALGYGIDIAMPPGEAQLYLRADSTDPLVLPIELLTPQQAQAQELRNHYWYGFLYGVMLALAAFNLTLFADLRQRSYLYYALYLLCLVVGNIAYTGHGYAWLWPDAPHFQRYVILAMMVVLSAVGLLFACSFLSVADHAPRLERAVHRYIMGGLLVLALLVAFDQHRTMAQAAFVYMTAFAVIMVALGTVAAVRWRAPAARHFLVAAWCGMLGASLTVFAVWGILPYTTLSYHGLEAGVLLEAVLLARAVAYRMRVQQDATLQAERLAGTDPLTGLPNRRAFVERAAVILKLAERSQRAASVIMLDLDHFKRINDQLGHDAGDRVLVAAGALLQRMCRASDIAARWGGEEFIILMPDTTAEQAGVFAERLRLAMQESSAAWRPDGQPVTASFGIAERRDGMSFNALVKAADVQLYAAKQGGRNRVCFQTLAA
jgi:diguanylate cyclase (GGDEF)-like protein